LYDMLQVAPIICLGHCNDMAPFKIGFDLHGQ